MVESLERDLHCSSSDSNASDSEAECVTETDCEEELAQPPNPKQPRKDSGAAKYHMKFNPDWKKEFPFVSGVSWDPRTVYFGLCILSIYIIFSAR